MFISYRYRFVFIEIPRTASRALGQALTSLHKRPEYLSRRLWRRMLRGLGSAQRKEYEQLTHHRLLIPQGLEDFFTFACVRNPYSREVSHYLYRRTRTDNNMYERASQWTFPEYVNWAIDTQLVATDELERRSLNIGEKNADTHDYPQSQQLKGKRLDKILFFEKLPDDCYALPFWPSDMTLPNSNANKPYNWQSFYNQELADLVYEWSHCDFDLYGYERNSWKAGGQ